MNIAIKDGNTVYVGITILLENNNSHPSDMILQENLPVWKVGGKKGGYAMCKCTSFSSTILRYNKKLFKQMDEAYICGAFAHDLREELMAYNLLDNRGCWRNYMFIICGQNVYEIDSYFNVVQKEDFACDGYIDLVSAELRRTQGMPPIDRIVSAYRLIHEMKRIDLFPIVILNTATGKFITVEK